MLTSYFAMYGSNTSLDDELVLINLGNAISLGYNLDIQFNRHYIKAGNFTCNPIPFRFSQFNQLIRCHSLTFHTRLVWFEELSFDCMVN